jgi:hypothetical protein
LIKLKKNALDTGKKIKINEQILRLNYKFLRCVSNPTDSVSQGTSRKLVPFLLKIKIKTKRRKRLCPLFRLPKIFCVAKDTRHVVQNSVAA